MNKIKIVLLTLICGACITSLIGAQGENLLKNGGFDSLKNWEVVRSLNGKIESMCENELSFVRMSPVNSSFQSGLFAVQQQWLPPVDGGKFLMIVKVRLNSNYAGSSPRISVYDNKSKTYIFDLELKGDIERDKWLEFTQESEIQPSSGRVYVQVIVFGKDGYLDLDELKIVEMVK